jgi:hypothetical protein
VSAIRTAPRRWLEGAAVGLLLSLFAGQSLSALWHKSNAFDETAHLASGYASWRFNDNRLQPEIGNLPKRLAGLFLLTQRVIWPPEGQPGQPPASGFRVGQELLFEMGNDPEKLLHLARLGLLLSGLGLGLTVYFWSRRLHGPVGGLLSLALFSFCPTMLAHGAMITSDMTSALFFLLASWTFWELLTQVTVGRCFAAGVALAGLCLSKHSAPLFAPMAATLLLVRSFDSRPLLFTRGADSRLLDTPRQRGTCLAIAVAAVIFTAWVIIWASYGFRFAAAAESPGGGGPFAWDQLRKNSGLLDQTLDIARRWYLLPEGFLYGLKGAVASTQIRLGFLDGALSMTGWWWFFPYALLVKTPLSVFAIWATALWAALRASPGSARPGLLARLAPSLPIWTLLIVYWIAAMRVNLNIGHRHILVTYPALYVLCGALGPAAVSRGRVFRGLLLVLFLGLIGESLAIRPHYLAFFNAASGGPSRGYQRLVDSSLDWGQDLPTLKTWLDKNVSPAAEPVYLSYFGTSSPQHYGIRAFAQPHFGVGVRSDDPEYFLELNPGVYCISATHFQNVQLPLPSPWGVLSESKYQALRPLYRAMIASRFDPGDFTRVAPEWRSRYRTFAALRWARLVAYLRSKDRRPDANAGYSILIFRLSEQELREALEGPMPRDPLRVKT